MVYETKSKEVARFQLLSKQLDAASAQMALPGIATQSHKDTLIEQIIESCRRIEFVETVRQRPISAGRADPHSPSFDPIRAAILKIASQDFDEAYWLIFLSTHFGKHSRDGWTLTRKIYGRMDVGPNWTWQNVSSNPTGFKAWLKANRATLGKWRFGNHRKYESLDADSSNGTGASITSYIQWIAPPRTHMGMLQSAQQQAGQDPKALFDYLFRQMKTVKRFGRLGAFDFLTMVSKVGLVNLTPPKAYLSSATGPKRGAKLLFHGSVAASARSRDLEERLIQLDGFLDVGQQALEDSICNWQKSPSQFIPFR